MSLFSGAELNVDASHGLNGLCDFVLSGSATQTELDAPRVTIVEANYLDAIERILGVTVHMLAEATPRAPPA